MAVALAYSVGSQRPAAIAFGGRRIGDRSGGPGEGPPSAGTRGGHGGHRRIDVCDLASVSNRARDHSPASSPTRPGRSNARAQSDRLADLRGQPRFDSQRPGAPAMQLLRGGARVGSAGTGKCAGFTGTSAGSTPVAASSRCGASGSCRADRLLDLHLHQLHRTLPALKAGTIATARVADDRRSSTT